MQVCSALGAVAESSHIDGARCRHLSYPISRRPFAVSGPRGVACVLTATQRAVLYDLEENEEDDEMGAADEEDDGEEGGEDRDSC
jgi:hypothetical protein